MHRKRIITFLIIFINSYAIFAQFKPYNQAYIWRGFKHQWTYNHRCNRLGDYVQNRNGNPVQVHCSATGLGADSTHFTSYYTSVVSPDAVFKEGALSFRIKGRERKLIEKTVPISIPAEEWLRGKSAYITLINGFDLHSKEAADKIQVLSIALDDGEYNNATNEIRFNAYVRLVFNCQSLECAPGRDGLVYDMDLYFLIVGCSEDNIAITHNSFKSSHAWDKVAELNAASVEKSLPGNRSPQYPYATVGIKSFGVVLNEAHWLLQLDNSVSPLNYTPENGVMTLSVDLLFKEWQEGMKKSDAAPKQSKFAEKRNGWELMDMDVLMMQFRDARVSYMQHSGSMFWHGGNEPSEGDKAISTYSIKQE